MCMDIIKEREELRRSRIVSMRESITKAKDPDLDKLVMLCSEDWGMSLRTVKEYLKIALESIRRASET